MKNMSDVRTTFYNMAVQVYGIEQANAMWEELETITSDGVEIFPMNGFKGMHYVIHKTEDGQWTWTFEDPVDGPEHGEVFDSRRRAMLDAARDADDTVVVDDRLGDRIREAI